MSFNNFKKVIALATVLATISCLVPESAQAIRLRYSGSPNAEETILDFTINTSAPGSFQGAIENAELTCKIAGGSLLGPLCREIGQKYVFGSGDLTPTLLSENQVRYDASLEDADSNELNFAIRITSEDSQLIQSLFQSPSDLSLFSEPGSQPGGFEVAAALNNTFGDGAFIDGFKVTQVPDSVAVPDPDATGGLLSAGAISALLLLKRNRHSRKLAQSGPTQSKI